MDRITIRVSIATIILAGIGGYALYESRNLLRGPIITIERPINGMVTNDPVTEIKGVVRNISKISMNDRDISVDESGVFQEKFALSSGNNTVKVMGEDRFGRRSESFVEILYEEPNRPLVKNDKKISEYQ